MKKIGLIGGMSWESSQIYYKIINEKVHALLGGFHSAKCVMDSVDFAEIEKLQHQNDWKALDEEMVKAAKNLENASAQLLLICTNTMHLCYEAICANTTVPVLHIAVETAKKITAKKCKKVLLLGTQFTMEKDFYKTILKNDFHIDVLVPNEADRKLVHQIIYEELVLGKITSASKKTYIQIIEKAIKNGAEGVILGCTEIPLLIQDNDVAIPTFDTTRIHAESAVSWALQTN